MVNNESVKSLYKALLDNGYTSANIGDENTFSNMMSDKNNRKMLYDYVASQGDNIGDYDSYEKRLSGYTDLPSQNNRAKQYKNAYDEVGNQAQDSLSVMNRTDDTQGMVQPQPQAEQEYIDTFGGGFKQGTEQLYQGLRASTAETANLVGGSSRDYMRASEQLDEMLQSGYDLSNYDSDKALKDYKDRDYQRRLTQWQAEMNKRRAEREDMDFFDKLAHKWNDPDRPKSQYEETGAVADEIQLARSYNIIRDALQETNGDIEAAKALIAERSKEKTWGDKQIEGALDAISQMKETKGFGAWVGGMIPQMIGNVAGIAAQATGFGKLGALLGIGNMAALTTSSAGSSMLDARKYGASEGDVWKAGTLSGAIEAGTEAIPFARYFTKGQNVVAKGVDKLIGKAIGNNPKAAQEVTKLIDRARKEYGTDFLNGRTLKEYAIDLMAEGASEAVAEGTQTLLPMLYQNPEDYPTLTEVLEGAWEGAKGGLFMGAFLGAGNRLAKHHTRDKVRKENGNVMFAETKENGIVEIFGEKDGLYKGSDAEGNDIILTENDIVETASVTYNEYMRGVKEVEAEQKDYEQNATDAYNLGMETDNGADIRTANKDAKKAASALGDEGLATSIAEAANNGSGIDGLLGGLDAEKQQQAREYYNQQMRLKGIRDRVESEIQQEIEERNAEIDRVSDENGMYLGLTITQRDERGEEVQVRGNVVGYVGGAPVWLPYDAENVAENRRILKPTEYNAEDLNNAVPKEERKASIADIVRHNREKVLENYLKYDPEVYDVEYGSQFQVGETTYVPLNQNEFGLTIYQAIDAEGNAVGVPTVVTADEMYSMMQEAKDAAEQQAERSAERAKNEPIIQLKSGQYIMATQMGKDNVHVIEVDEQGNPVSNPEIDENVDYKTYDAWKKAHEEKQQAQQANNMSAESAQNEVAPTEESEQNVSEEVQQGEELADESASEAVASPSQPTIPTEGEEVLYHKVPVDVTLADLNDGTLDEVEQDEFIAAKKAEAAKMLDNLNKKKPKVGTNKAKYLAEKQAWEQKVTEAQSRADYWNNVEKAMRDSRVKVGDAVAEEVMQLDQAMNGAELAAQMLAQGRLPLLQSSYKEETGYGQGETQGMFGLFRSAENGGMTIDHAAELLALADEEEHNGHFFGGDSEVARNTLLQVLSEVQTRGGLNNYISNIREQQAKAEQAAEYEAYEQGIQAMYGVSVGEYEAAYNDYLHNNPYDGVDVNEIDAIFADAASEYEQYLNNIDNGQGTITEGTEGGNDVLLEEQPDNEGRVEESKFRGQAEGDVSSSNDTNEVAQGKEQQVAKPRKRPIGFGKKKSTQERFEEEKAKFANSLQNEYGEVLRESSSVEEAIDKLQEKADQARAEAKDWANRKYKDNKSVVTGTNATSAADEYETTIGAANERRRQANISRLLNKAKEYEEWIRILSERTGFTPTESRKRVAEEEDILAMAERIANEEKRRKPLRKRARELERTLGVKVNLIERIEDVPNRAARAAIEQGQNVTGWYEQSTGEVCFYMPNLANESEVDATYIHEVVAHKGLRGMLGDKFDAFCDDVWDMMSDADKAKFINYPGVNGDTRAAADEYIAHLAENVDVTESTWSKFTELLKKFLKAIGIEPKMTDADIANAIKQSYQRLLSGKQGENVGEGTRFMVKKGGIRVPDDEYAKIAHQILTYPEKEERGHVFTDNYYYLCTDIDDNGNFRIVASIKIEGNEEFIRGIRKGLPLASFVPISESESIIPFIDRIRNEGGRISRNYAFAERQSKTTRRNDSVYLGKQTKSTRNKQVSDTDDGTSKFRIASNRFENGMSNDELHNSEQGVRFRAVTEPLKIAELEAGKKVKVYRAMQLVDGKLYPPMSAKVNGKMRDAIELGRWEEAEERPEMADDKGYFKLDKGNGKSLKARYNPYIHTSTTPLNDQFSSAQDRPELVTVEVEIPESELTSGYKADKAKDAVGKLEWKAGVVQGKLSGTRTVILSRWDKPIRIVPDSEVADEIVKMFGDKQITMPSNVVTPSLRAELEKRGVPFVETDNQGKEVGGTRFRAVYHGSAAEFDKFSKDFIGSGEGQSVMGHGFYVTTSEGTSEYYANVASENKRKIVQEGGYTFNGKVVRDRGLVSAYELLKNNNFDADKAIERANHRIEIFKERKGIFANTSTTEKAIEYLEAEKNNPGSIGYQEEIVEKPSRVKYEVEIPDDTGKNYLDLDKKATKKFKDESKKRMIEVLDNGEEASYWKKNRDIINYEWESVDKNDATNDTVRGTMEQFISQEEVANIFSEMGYVGSKAKASDGTTYIIYNEDDIEIKSSTRFRVSEPALDYAEEEDVVDVQSGDVVYTLNNVDNQLYKTSGKYMRRLYKNGEIGRVLKGEYAEIDQIKAREEYNHAKPILEEYLSELEEMKSKSSNAAQRIIDGVISDIEYALDYYKNLSLGKDVWRTDAAPRFRVSDAPFYSNAERAVEGIKQEKATPQQWLAMIEKNGGLKAGEDKWLGLSDWLKGQDAKSLTKQEVLEYINANQIQIEEVHYWEGNYDDFEAQIILKKGLKFRDDFFDAFDFNEEGGYGHEVLIAEIRDTEKAIELYENETGIKVQLDEEGYIEDYNDEEDIKAWAASLYNHNPIHSTRLDYTTGGLENNREIALVVPTIESWNKNDEVHFGDAGDGRAVAWIRFGETRGEVAEKESVDKFLADMRSKYNAVEGEETDYMNKDEIKHLQSLTSNEIDARENAPRILVIDEIQSKRHQEGREKGYKTTEDNAGIELRQRIRDYENRMVEKYNPKYINMLPFSDAMRGIWTEDEERAYKQMVSSLGAFVVQNKGLGNRIPSAPFEKNWHELAMKRMLRYAAENGYDKVAWTKGAQQAERYKLGDVIDELNAGKWQKDENGFSDKPNDEVKEVYASLSDGGELQYIVNREGVIVSDINDAHQGRTLTEVFGKDIAIKLMGEEGVSLEDTQLVVGAEGMKGFYDEMLPRFMNKYGKKWGVKVGEVELPNLEESARKMWSVDVTDAMKDSVMEGQPMFRISNGGLTNDQVRALEFVTGKSREEVVRDYGKPKNRISKKDAIEARNEMSKFIPRAKNTLFYNSVADLLNPLSGISALDKAYIIYTKLKGIQFRGFYNGHNKNVVLLTEYILNKDRAKGVIVHEYTHLVVNKLLKDGVISESELDDVLAFCKRRYPDIYRKATIGYKESAHSQECISYLNEHFYGMLGDKFFEDATFAGKSKHDKLFSIILNELKNEEGTNGNNPNNGRKGWSNLSHRRGSLYGRDDERGGRERRVQATEQGRASGNSEGVRFRVGIGAASQAPLATDTISAWDKLAKSTMFQLRETAVDYLTAVEKFQDLISKRTKSKVLDFENSYQAFLHLSSRNKDAMDMFDSFIVAPLNKVISKLTNGEKVGDWETGKARELVVYVEAKHGLERNRQMAVEQAAKKDKTTQKSVLESWQKTKETILNNTSLTWRQQQEQLDAEAIKLGADLTQDHSGLSDKALFGDDSIYRDGWKKAAYDAVEAYENANKGLIDELWQCINNATEYSLRKQLDSGLVDKDYVATQLERFQYYIPLRGFSEEIAEEVYAYMGETRRSGSPVKKARGRVSEADNPFGAILQVAYSSISVGNKNLAKQKLLNLVQNHDTEGLVQVNKGWIVKFDTAVNEPLIQTPQLLPGEPKPEWVEALPVIPSDATPEEISKILADFEAKMAELKDADESQLISGKNKTQYRTLHDQRDEHQILVMRGGKPYVITIVGNPRLAQAVNGLLNPDSGDEGTLLDTARRVQRFMAGAFTSHNPAFSFANISRDTIYSNNQAFIKENPLYWAKFTANQKLGFGMWGRMIEYLYKYKNGKLDLSKKEQKLFKEFMENGGATGYTFVETQKESAKKLAEELKNLGNGSTKLTAKVVGKSLLDCLEFMGQTAEIINRYAAYKTSREMGRSISRSITDAKEITVNFNRKGAGMKTYDKNNRKLVNIASAISQYGRESILFWNANMQAKYRLYKNMKEHPLKTSTTLIANSMFIGGVAIPVLNDVLLPSLYSLFGWGGDDDEEEKYYDVLTDWERTHNICLRLPNSNWLKIPLSPEMIPFYSMGDIINGNISGKREFNVSDYIASAIDVVTPVQMNWEYEGWENVINFTPTVTQPLLQNFANVNYMGNNIAKESMFGNVKTPEFRNVYRNTSSTLVGLSKLSNKLGGGNYVEKGVGITNWNPAYIQNLISGYTGGYGTSILAAADWIVDTANNEPQAVIASKLPLVSRFFISGNKDIKQRRLDSKYYDVTDFCKEVEYDLREYNKGVNGEFESYFTIAESTLKLNELMKSERFSRYNELKPLVKEIKRIEEKLEDVGEDELTRALLNEKKLRALEILDEN